MRPILSATLALIAAACAAAPALADPCLAIPDRGPAPVFRPGQTFAGTVRYIGDGDSVCVGTGVDPRTWLEVRLADFSAPELSEPGGRQARSAMSSIALGQRAQGHLRTRSGR